MRLRRLMVVFACAAAAGPLVLTGGPAGAAPLDFAPDGKIDAVCFGVNDGMEIKGITGLVPAPGDGAFTPYFVNNGQVLVPTSFQLTSGFGLKSRHLLNDKVTKPGKPGTTTCYVTGDALAPDGSTVRFTAVIVGNLVGPVKVTAP